MLIWLVLLRCGCSGDVVCGVGFLLVLCLTDGWC